jgi:TRAP-type C4-dicarboxylate transport system substrate-binding protein
LVAPAVAQTPRETVVAAYVVPGAPASVVVENFAAKIGPLSQGRLATKVLIHGEAGSEEQVLAGLRRGRVQVASVGNAPLGTLVPEMGLINMPFLAYSQDEFDFIFDHYLRGELTRLLAEKGLLALHWIELGPSNIYSTVPIVAVEDIKGLPIRATFDEGTKAFLTAVGADVIPLPTPEVLPALQTGMIKGATSVAIAYVGTGLAEAAPHYTLTEHQYTGVFIVVDAAWHAGLDDVARAALVEAMPSTDEIRKFFRDLERRELDDAKTLTIHRPTPDQRLAWAAAAARSHPAILRAIGGRAQQMYDRMQDLRADFAVRTGG